MKLRIFIFAIAAVIVGFVGWSLYGYFFSKSAPSLSIYGIDNGKYYSGNIKCLVDGSDDYKVSSYSVMLDSKPLVSVQKINRGSFKDKFIIDTDSLNNGKHDLLLEIENGAYDRKKATKKLTFYVDNVPLQADFVKNKEDIKVRQGRTLHIQFQTNKPLEKAIARSGINTYNCFPEQEGSLVYECYIPIDCEEKPGEYLLTINLEDKVGNSLTLKNKYQVLNVIFERQKINIKNNKIEEENKLGRPEKDLEQELKDLSEKSPNKKLWQGNFLAPTEIQKITTEFGVTRLTPERGFRQHKALDIYNTPKAPICASQDGIIVLKDRFAHSGKTIGIDHGCGLISLYYHLDEFADVELGEEIKKGFKVGTLGKTGYATGYHLHWEMRLNNIAIDPMQWVKYSFNN